MYWQIFTFVSAFPNSTTFTTKVLKKWEKSCKRYINVAHLYTFTTFFSTLALFTTSTFFSQLLPHLPTFGHFSLLLGTLNHFGPFWTKNHTFGLRILTHFWPTFLRFSILFTTCTICWALINSFIHAKIILFTIFSQPFPTYQTNNDPTWLPIGQVSEFVCNIRRIPSLWPDMNSLIWIRWAIMINVRADFINIRTNSGNIFIRSGAVFRSEGSPLNPKDLLQIYVILAVGACVLCQFKVCCDVCWDSNTWIYCTVLWI